MVTHLPPQKLEAEQSILGGLMLDAEAWDQVADILVAEDFYKPAHQIIYNVIKELQARSQPIDLITVSNALEGKNELDRIGGSDYLLELHNKVISSANIASYATIVREKSLLRKVISTCTGVIEKAYAQDFENVDSFLDSAESEIFKISESRQATGLIGSMEIVKQSIEKIEQLISKKAEVTGIATGFKEMDKITAGLQPGDLIIVAARPSMGKTAFSLNIAQHVALREKKTVAFFSIEMGRESVMMRILAAEARVNISDIRTGRIPDSSFPKLINTAGLLSDASLYIDDTSGISPFEIRARCRRLKAKFGLDLIMVDYLQIMDLKQKVDSRERAVAEISRNLKAIAKELYVPVVALAQLNRGVEGRADRKPMLSDLRESGAIEQDADIIMMLYREDYYDKEDPEKRGHAKVVIGKHRNGPTGEIDLRFEGQFGRFKDAPPQSSHPMPPPLNEPPRMSGKAKNFAPGMSN